MQPYHKIKTLWTRDPETKWKTLIEGQWDLPVFEALSMAKWDWYEKVDGTNMRVIFAPEGPMDAKGWVEFRGRTDRAQIPAHLTERLDYLFDVDFFFEHFDLDKSGDSTITLYGEGFGPKIQSGGKYGETVDFCLFDVRIGDMWMEQAFVSELAQQARLQRAPLVGQGTLWDAIYKTADGFLSKWGAFDAEGLIVRPGVELFDRLGNRVIGKIKLKDFTI